VEVIIQNCVAYELKSLSHFFYYYFDALNVHY